MSDIKIKALRTIYAGNTPHAVSYTNLTKVPLGSPGMIFKSYISEKLVVYVAIFEIENKCVFAFINDTSFEIIS